MATSKHLSSLSKKELIELLVNASIEASSVKEERDIYKTERDDYKGKLDQAYAERDKLRAIIVKLQRHQFGRRSERLSPDQLQLALEDLTQTLAAMDAATEAEEEKAPEGDEQKQERKAVRPATTTAALCRASSREHHFIERKRKSALLQRRPACHR